jgi:pyruvate,water dikinase
MWFLAREHVPGPVSRLYYEALSHGATGWDRAAAAYGLPDGATRWGNVNGWMYYGGRPTVDAGELAARDAVAAETLRIQRWRDDLRRWHEETRPRFVATNRALQAEDPAGLDDAALGAHVGRALDAWWDAVPEHFALHHMYSVGAGTLMETLLAGGAARADVMAQLGGGSPESARARALVDAIVAEVGDRAVRTIEDLRGPALDAYLGEHGWRAIERDLTGPVLIERPELVIAAVQARQRGHGGAVQPTSTGDPVLDELRALYGCNDDNGGITISWPMGLVRRAGLEVGRRVGLADPNDAFECSAGEMRVLLAGAGPSPAELRARAAVREAAAAADPPVMLRGSDGTDPLAPALPPSVARIVALSGVLWAGDPPPTTASGEPLSGTGIGTGVYRGRACVIDDDAGMDQLEPGDVIIAFCTGSQHNTVFPIAGAVATEAGGALSHPAVLSRELGLPAVVGVRGLLAAVRTGDVVEVDAAAGVVRVVG